MGLLQEEDPSLDINAMAACFYILKGDLVREFGLQEEEVGFIGRVMAEN